MSGGFPPLSQKKSLDVSSAPTTPPRATSSSDRQKEERACQSTRSLTVTPASSATKWYQLYRGKVGGAAGALRLIARIPNAAGAGATTVNDYNDVLPYCTTAWMWQQNLDCMSLKQLAPMLKIPLAVVDLSVRWAQVLYCAPTLYAPGRATRIINIGRSGL